MPAPAKPSSDAPSRCLQNIRAEGKSVLKGDHEFSHLDDVASSSVTGLGVDGNQCIYSEDPEALDLDANGGTDCSSTHVKISTNHESSQSSEQQTQINRRGSITEPSGKGLDLSSWLGEPIILNDPTQESECSPNLKSLGSENLFWELGEFGIAREDESPDECDYHTTPSVGKQWFNYIADFDQAFALMTPSTTTDGTRAMCGPISLDQTFDELSTSDFALIARSQKFSSASQCPMHHMEQYGNQSAAIDFASSPGSDESCMPSSPAISNLNTSCQCIPRALSILEDLEVESFQPTKDIAPDHALKCLRRCLQQCTKILDCKLLKWTSEFLVLLTVISRNMLDAFDILDSEAQPHKWSFPPLCSLGKYDLESPEEIQCLMNWLVLIQTKKLAAFLDRLRRITEEYNWAERHHGLLSLLEQRCLQLVRRLRRKDFTAADESGAAEDPS